MGYAVASELSSRIGSSIFTEIYGSGTSHPEADSDLESAAAEIDGAIAARYQIPISGTRSLALLKDWCLTLAEERAYARPVGGDFTEKIKRRVDQVRKYLDMIRADQFKLPDAPENSAASGSNIALVKCDAPLFDRRKMGGF